MDIGSKILELILGRDDSHCETSLGRVVKSQDLSPHFLPRKTLRQLLSDNDTCYFWTPGSATDNSSNSGIPKLFWAADLGLLLPFYWRFSQFPNENYLWPEILWCRGRTASLLYRTHIIHSFMISLSTSYVVGKVLAGENVKIKEKQSLITSEANGEDRYLLDNHSPVIQILQGIAEN